MSEIGGSQSSRGGGFPQVFFHQKEGLSKALFQMGSLTGLSNPGYNPDPDADDAELDIDYDSFADDQEFKDNDQGVVPGVERDSMRSSHKERDSMRSSHKERDSMRSSHKDIGSTRSSKKGTGLVSDKMSFTGSSRVSKSRLGDDVDTLSNSSDEYVGHFRPGSFNSSEESLMESNFEGGRHLSLEEDTL